MLNKGQGDLLRRPYLPLRHGANLRLRGFRNFYSHVDSYVEIVLVLPRRKRRKTSKGLINHDKPEVIEPIHREYRPCMCARTQERKNEHGVPTDNACATSMVFRTIEARGGA